MRSKEFSSLQLVNALVSDFKHNKVRSPPIQKSSNNTFEPKFLLIYLFNVINQLGNFLYFYNLKFTALFPGTLLSKKYYLGTIYLSRERLSKMPYLSVKKKPDYLTLSSNVSISRHLHPATNQGDKAQNDIKVK